MTVPLFVTFCKQDWTGSTKRTDYTEEIRIPCVQCIP